MEIFQKQSQKLKMLIGHFPSRVYRHLIDHNLMLWEDIIIEKFFAWDLIPNERVPICKCTECLSRSAFVPLPILLSCYLWHNNMTIILVTDPTDLLCKHCLPGDQGAFSSFSFIWYFCASHTFVSVLESHIFHKEEYLLSCFHPSRTSSVFWPGGHEGQAVNIDNSCLWIQAIHSASTQAAWCHRIAPLSNLLGVPPFPDPHCCPCLPWSPRTSKGMLFERKIWKVIATLSSPVYFFHSWRIYRKSRKKIIFFFFESS